MAMINVDLAVMIRGARWEEAVLVTDDGAPMALFDSLEAAWNYADDLAVEMGVYRVRVNGREWGLYTPSPRLEAMPKGFSTDLPPKKAS